MTQVNRVTLDLAVRPTCHEKKCHLPQPTVSIFPGVSGPVTLATARKLTFILPVNGRTPATVSGAP